MPDSPAGSAAFLSGQEIINDARTLAYLANGYGPLNMQILGGCACPNIQELIECDATPYSSPMSDPAPWFDDSVPESADFAGFLVTEFEGLGSTYTRTTTDKVTGGAVLGRLRPGPRPMIWRGYLFGRSDCAVRYGLSWMTANLVGNVVCDTTCGGEELELLVCCPEVTGSPPVSGCNGPITQPNPCPPFVQPNAFRTLKNVGLVDGPKILSQRKIGCKNCGASDACAGDSLIMEIEFTLMAGNPYMFGCPVCLCVQQGFPIAADCDTDPVWVKVDPNNPPATCADPSFCPPPFDCTEQDTLCDPVDLPDLPPFEDGCFCDPIQPVQNCCPIPADSFGQFFEGAPVIEITTGPTALRNTTIRFFENLLGKPCCDVSENPCLNCDSLQIRYIPPSSTMIIDGTTRRVTVQCAGMSAPQPAEHLTVTPFAWPILQCIDFCICVETDSIVWGTNPPDATVTVYIVPREM